MTKNCIVYAKIYRFNKTGSLDPPARGGRKMMVTTDYVIGRIKEIKASNPALFAREIRKR